MIVAMLVFAVSAALVVAMRGEFLRFYQRNANILMAEQSQAYLRGAEELATLALQRDYDLDQETQQPRDTLDEIWAQPPQPYALEEGGWMSGSLEDLQGRFNLNTLVPGESGENDVGEERFTEAQKQFIRLLQALEEPELSQYEATIITRAIGDWLDGDQFAGANGAEDTYYSGLTPAYRAANRPMASVSELRAVANVTPALYRALEPWVTVWPREPGGASLNIHTAPATVLRSINDTLSPLSEDEGEQLVQYRQEAGFTDKREFLEHPVFQGKEGMEAVANELLGESSSYFLLSAQAELAGRNMRLYSVLERRNRRVAALARAGGSL